MKSEEEVGNLQRFIEVSQPVFAIRNDLHQLASPTIAKLFKAMSLTVTNGLRFDFEEPTGSGREITEEVLVYVP